MDNDRYAWDREMNLLGGSVVQLYREARKAGLDRDSVSTCIAIALIGICRQEGANEEKIWLEAKKASPRNLQIGQV